MNLKWALLETGRLGKRKTTVSKQPHNKPAGLNAGEIDDRQVIRKDKKRIPRWLRTYKTNRYVDMANIQKTETTVVRILVVEDEEKLGRFVCMLLGQMGYSGTLCRHTDEAKRLLGLNTWDLVLTDIVLPGENGFDLFYWVRQHYRNIPVIAMTAHSTEAVNHRMSKLGFSAILHKPFTVEHFQRVVQQTGLPIFPTTTADHRL